MTTLTLTEILGEPRQWSPKDNPERIFNSYRVKDDKGVVYEINRKASSPPPELGTGEYEVTPAKGDFPPKLKKVFAGGGGRQGGQGLSKEEWAAKDKRIARAGVLQAVVSATRVEPVPLAGDAGSLIDYVASVNHITDALLASLDERAPHPGSGLGGGVGQQEPANRAPAVESSATRGRAAREGRSENWAEGVSVLARTMPGGDLALPPEPASPSRKGQTSKKLNALGVDPETQRQLVHAFAGNPPTEAGLDAIDAALEAQDYATLFDEQGIQRPAFLPDTRDLAPAEVL